jgi:glycosyltransferase involved in cell wall biosynthesis
MKELVIICGTLEAGGAERVISTLSHYLPNAFPLVSIFTWFPASSFYEIDSRVNVVSITDEAGSSSFLGKARWLRNYVKSRKNNIIVLSFLSLFSMKTLTALFGVKTVKIVAERNDPRFVKGGILTKTIRNLLYRSADGILCQTDTVRSFYNGALLKKTAIIFNPLYISQADIGKALHSQKSNRIVTIGRLRDFKRFDLLIKAFALFHKAQPAYTLTIYGEGEQRRELEELVSELGLKDFVFLPGKQKNVHDLILDANAFIMTSLHEGMSNALIESMALGLPCISTKVSGANELIHHGENGLLTDATPEDIAKHLLAVANDPLYATTLAKNAVKVSEILDQHVIANQWIEYLSRF